MAKTWKAMVDAPIDGSVIIIKIPDGLCLAFWGEIEGQGDGWRDIYGGFVSQDLYAPFGWISAPQSEQEHGGPNITLLETQRTGEALRG